MKKLASNIDFIKDDRAQIITIDGVRVDYPNGWGLVRPSNTTPNIAIGVTIRAIFCINFWKNFI
jgi:phosphomannomutase/phosphoglucomutase